jgi:hypothetical protein
LIICASPKIRAPVSFGIRTNYPTKPVEISMAVIYIKVALFYLPAGQGVKRKHRDCLLQRGSTIAGWSEGLLARSPTL